MSKFICLCICAVCLLSGSLGAVAGDLKRASEEVQSSRMDGTLSRLQCFEIENAALKVSQQTSRESIATLVGCLAEANAEVEVFRREYANLKLRMETLGIESVVPIRSPFEQRFLKSMSDLRVVAQENDKLDERITRIVELALRTGQPSQMEGQSVDKLQLEEELRHVATHKETGATYQANAKRHTGKVISLEPKLSLLVADFGSLQGIKIGMFLTITRGELFVGRARVVQVRDGITGALVENDVINSSPVRVGDQLRVEVQS